MIDKRLIEDILKIPDKPTWKYVNDPKYIGRIPKKQHRVLQNLLLNHINSFNYFIDEGFAEGINSIPPYTYVTPHGETIGIQVTSYRLCTPTVDRESFVKDTRIFPAECRQRGTSYLAPLYLEFVWSINGKCMGSFEEKIGDLPVMVKSKLCHLNNLTPAEMIRRKEDSEEFGGYFIINGNERIIRMLIAPRRNYPISLSRGTWKDSFPFVSEFGVSMRCVGKGERTQNMVLHYLTNGTAKLKVFFQAKPLMVPVLLVLRALVDYSDKKIYKRLMSGYVGSERAFYSDCIISMMKMLKKLSISFQDQAIKHLGEHLKEAQSNLPDWSFEEAGKKLIEYSIATHLEKNEDKFSCIVIMIQKCFSAAKGGCQLENEDNPMFQEVHSPGQIYFNLLVERIELLLEGMKMVFNRYFSDNGRLKAGVDVKMTKEILVKLLRMRMSTVCNALKMLVGTGNLQSSTGLGLKQRVGISVTAEKINYLRFLSNFRAIHRGQFFTEMRTTHCRKLYPEAWGFLCPVHTPDGTPCGLLNHLSIGCVVTCNRNQNTFKAVKKAILKQPVIKLDCLDETNVSESLVYPPDELANNYYPIMLDGCLIAYVKHTVAESVQNKLRILKVQETDSIPNDIEICIIPKTLNPTQYPGFFVFTNIFRMMRPVINKSLQDYEYIGSFEQVYMDISIRDNKDTNLTTHTEILPTMFLSMLGCLIPYPDFNQSPRNMYCCQMTKQTMGQASHTLNYRCDTKMYRIEMPQTPLVKPAIYDHYHLDEHPLGTNAVVAVISYTGYDMEDAMIINKASAERGFTTGSVQKTITVDLKALGNAKGTDNYVYKFGFLNELDKARYQSHILDDNGLPYIGARVETDNVFCAYYPTLATVESKTKVETYKSAEVAYVSDVKLLGCDSGKELTQKVAITLWIPRRPFVGDKYANRHGQKGVCSLLWPQEDMPFTESGMTPDIIFNPHGYPSRMTIGMMLESMSGKASAMLAEPIDATPFKFSEDNTAGDNYGEMLQKAGFNYYGTEKMYSGVDGNVMTADIFVGLIYYIRLRHMVSDKYQVRSTGAIDQITHQPVKGRRRGGGVRFGEMERDSLLAHGTSFLLQDRLFNCSDRSLAYACKACGSLVTVSKEFTKQEDDPEKQPPASNKPSNHRQRERGETKFMCRLCNSQQNCRKILIPHVLTYLSAELAQCNIALKLNLTSV